MIGNGRDESEWELFKKEKQERKKHFMKWTRCCQFGRVSRYTQFRLVCVCVCVCVLDVWWSSYIPIVCAVLSVCLARLPLAYSIRYPDTESHFVWPPLRIPAHLFGRRRRARRRPRRRDRPTARPPLFSQRNSSTISLFLSCALCRFGRRLANLLIITEKIQSDPPTK